MGLRLAMLHYAQYTPPTPTRLNCRLELHRRCVHNSQLRSLNKFTDSKVECRRVGGVNAPVRSRDQVHNFLCCWAIGVGDVAIVEKVINIDQNSRSQTAMFSFKIVDRIRRQSSSSCDLCSHRRRLCDATRQLRCVGVGGVYWALSACMRTV